MRAYTTITILLFGLQSFLYAQESSTQTKLDSIEQEVQKAFSLFQKSEYAKAIDIDTKILPYALETGNDVLAGRCYNLIGNCYYFINKDTLCFHYLFKAEKLFERAKDTFNLTLVYNDIGITYKDFDSLSQAKNYLNKALDIANASGYDVDKIYPLANIGDILIINEQEYAKGIEYCLNSLEILDNLNDDTKSIRAYLYESLSYAYFKLGDTKNYLKYFNLCEKTAQENKYFKVLKTLYKNQSDVHKEQNDYKSAYKFYVLYKSSNDSILKKREFEKAKQIEADNFIRENQEQLNLARRENNFKETTLKKSKTYNTIFAIFIVALLISLYVAYRKNKELKIAKERADELSKVKSNFYSEISHELRTPLFAVIELSTLLLKENVNKEHKEYLESLNFSGNHLLALINNVLEINKVESGKIKVEQIDFNLKILIVNIIDSLEYALRNSGNKIHLHYDDSIPEKLRGDSLKLTQILINLISNAIKFTTNGDIDITIKCVKNIQDKVQVFFEVKDNGLGISKEKQQKVFEDFYQEMTKTEKSYKGTGLGLTIVKRLLSALSSDISIDSEEDKGSTFSFELQFSKQVETLELNNSNDHILKALLNKHILIVDDNKINLLVTDKILSQQHIKAKTVHSGKEAIEAAKNNDFDCILMDINMPQLDGYETTKRIRKFDKDIPIIALTAASTDEIKGRIHESQMNGYILKPFHNADFFEKIYEVIHIKSSA